MEQRVQAHYDTPDLTQAIIQGLRAAGKNPERLNTRDLAPVDQLHTGGAAATRDTMALTGGKAAAINGAAVLDAGCGIGGSSRLLAEEFGYQVTGIDLSDAFIRAALTLTRATGLSGRVGFQQGSVSDLPFADTCFDAVLCQHLLMNIPEKPPVFESFFRVLKKGGRLILHEVVKGNNQPLAFPVPWAGDAAISHVLPWDRIQSDLEQAGFKIEHRQDTTGAAARWWGRVRDAAARPGAFDRPLGPHLVFGRAAVHFGKNMSDNLEQGRIRVMDAVLVKP